MTDLNVILHTLKNRPTMLLPHYAASLSDKIEKYLAGEITFEPKEQKTETTNVINGVAVININGAIMKRVGLPKEILEFFGIVDLDHVDAELKAARDNPEVHTVLCAVTSPGGFITGVQSTGNLVAEIAEKKEVVVYSDVLNASAAYWISSQANTIIGSVDSEFGSVGVYNAYADYSKMYENEGIKVTFFKAGKWKGLGHPFQPLTEEDKAFIQSEINETYELFKSTVNSKRTIADENLQGQTFSGARALEIGMIDGLASDINEVISALTQTA